MDEIIVGVVGAVVAVDAVVGVVAFGVVLLLSSRLV